MEPSVCNKNMINHAFEIKIALVGFVSVGKTTVLNALFRDKYGEVSMRRTTAGVNYFRLVTNNSLVDGASESPSTSTDSSTLDKTSSFEDDGSVRPAKSILKEITQDNATFRESDQIHEKYFEVELNEPLCEMRPDTQLVVVDIPGVNEAGVGEKYRAFVQDKWSTFDCVIVVMDGRQGVNTEEQVQFLDFIKENLDKKKNIPVIILANKIDTTDDEELNVLVDETRREVERVFQVQDCEKALDDVLVLASTQSSAKQEVLMTKYPLFIPVSAVHAFIYRTASLMPVDQIKFLDAELLDRIGCDEVGRFKWKKMSQEERIFVVHKAVSDPEQYEERLEATNFDKFLKVFSLSIGGIEWQRFLIERQIEVALNALSIGTTLLADQFRVLNRKCQGLGMELPGTTDRFWEIYNLYEDFLFTDYHGPIGVVQLSGAMKELIAFHEFCLQSEWKDEEITILQRMKILIRKQLGPVLAEKVLANIPSYSKEAPPQPLKWTDLTLEDWKTICRSFLMVSHDNNIISTLGQEIVWMEGIVDVLCKFAITRNNSPEYCPHCGRYTGGSGCTCETRVEKALGFNCGAGGELEPTRPDMHAKFFHIKVPESPADPSHWGHLAWTFGKFMAKREKDL